MNTVNSAIHKSLWPSSIACFDIWENSRRLVQSLIKYAFWKGLPTHPALNIQTTLLLLLLLILLSPSHSNQAAVSSSSSSLLRPHRDPSHKNPRTSCRMIRQRILYSSPFSDVYDPVPIFASQRSVFAPSLRSLTPFHRVKANFRFGWFWMCTAKCVRIAFYNYRYWI